MIAENTIRMVNGRFSRLLSIASALSGIEEPEMALTRRYPIIGWRFAIFYIMRQEGYSLHEIERGSGYHHSTVYHGSMRIAEALEMNTDRWFKQMYNDLSTADAEDTSEVIRTTDKRVRQWLAKNEVSEEVAARLMGQLATLKI